MRIYYWLLAILLVGNLYSCSNDTDINENRTTEHPVTQVILLIGDGMGISHVNSFMLEKGYQPTAFDRAKQVGFVKTYSANSRITDSAAAGTAIASGFKTDNGKVGMKPDGTPVISLLQEAHQRQWGTGIIVTCELTNATPAAFYAHVHSRSDEPEISRQLINSGIDILIGGGINNIRDEVFNDSIRSELKILDYAMIATPEQLEEEAERRIAFFMMPTGMLPTINRGRDTLLMTKLTTNTLNRLETNYTNFFLMIEGSQIDTESHLHQLNGILGEISDFDRVANTCLDYADNHPGTLVIITADHETGGLTLGGSGECFILPISKVSCCFSTTGHTGCMVPLYAYGEGAEAFAGIYDNTKISALLKSLLYWDKQENSN